MVAIGDRGDEQGPPGLLVRQPVGKVHQHLFLTGGELRERLAGALARSAKVTAAFGPPARALVGSTMGKAGTGPVPSDKATNARAHLVVRIYGRTPSMSLAPV